MNTTEINKDRMITIKTSEGEIKVPSKKIDEGWNRVMYGDRIKNTPLLLFKLLLKKNHYIKR